MTIREALIWAKGQLREESIEGPEASSELLLSFVLSKDKIYLFTHSDETLTKTEIANFKKCIARREKHEPVWYITGKIDFLGQDFLVNKDVLIPRPETELLVEKVAEHFREGFMPKRVLDIGTGSGVIIVSVANMLESHAPNDHNARFFASDISKEALSVAKHNAKNLAIDFRHGNLFEPWDGQKFDLITANLPYVPDGDRDSLAPDLVNFEPQLALFGGVDGLDMIRTFLDELPNYLSDNGKVFMEIGYEQGKKIKDYISNINLDARVTVLGDYAGVDRIVIIET